VFPDPHFASKGYPAATSPTFSTRGGASGIAPVSTKCAFMTSVTPSPRARWRWARVCRWSANCSVTHRCRRPPGTAHLARDTVKASAARIGDSIDSDFVATPW